MNAPVNESAPRKRLTEVAPLIAFKEAESFRTFLFLPKDTLRFDEGVLWSKGPFKVMDMIRQDEQLSILKSSYAMLQQSFYEGWETFAQEAKCIRFKLHPFNIPTHKKQRVSDSAFIKPRNYIVLPMWWQISYRNLGQFMMKVNSESTRAYAESTHGLFGEA